MLEEVKKIRKRRRKIYRDSRGRMVGKVNVNIFHYFSRNLVTAKLLMQDYGVKKSTAYKWIKLFTKVRECYDEFLNLNKCYEYERKRAK